MLSAIWDAEVAGLEAAAGAAGCAAGGVWLRAALAGLMRKTSHAKNNAIDFDIEPSTIAVESAEPFCCRC
jgi:hypothetical protein